MGNFYLNLPLVFLRFWFLEAPREQIAFFASLNRGFFQLFSLPLLAKTYFKPWKNEYREGLVGFSIGMGIFIKTIFILGDLLLLVFLLVLEISFFALWLFWPVGTILWMIL